MKPKDYDDVRVVLRGRVGGGITQADVQRRARELSLLSIGSENYTAEDLERAERELMIGGDPDAMTDDVHSSFGAGRDPGDPLADEGGMIEWTETADEISAPEKLAMQGVEDAQHDQMVEARKFRRVALRGNPAPLTSLPKRPGKQKPPLSRKGN